MCEVFEVKKNRGGSIWKSWVFSRKRRPWSTVSLVFVDLLSWFYLFLKLPVVLEALAEA